MRAGRHRSRRLQHPPRIGSEAAGRGALNRNRTGGRSPTKHQPSPDANPAPPDKASLCCGRATQQRAKPPLPPPPTLCGRARTREALRSRQSELPTPQGVPGYPGANSPHSGPWRSLMVRFFPTISGFPAPSSPQTIGSQRAGWHGVLPDPASTSLARTEAACWTQRRRTDLGYPRNAHAACTRLKRIRRCV